MKDEKKKKFKVFNNESEYETKLRRHRMRVGGIVFLVAAVLVILVIAVFFILKYRGYHDYEIIKKIKTEVLSEATFYDYNGDVLKVSKNGAIITDSEGEEIFNLSFEMNEPIVDISGKYIVVAERKGSNIYIMTSEGEKGHIVLTRKIRDVRVATQGTIAVISEEESTYYINLYDYNGNELVEGAMHIDNTGYPIAMDISDDATLLMVSVIDLKDGLAKSTINFYNFGSVGQNEIDNKVSSFIYEDTVIPRVIFFGNDKAVAIGDNKILFYTGSEIPEEEKSYELTTTIRSLAVNEEYIALICDGTKGVATGDATSTYVLSVYDAKGRNMYSEGFDISYSDFYLLSNDDVYIGKDGGSLIYAINGVKKYDGAFGNELLKITSSKSTNEYYILYRNRIEKVRLVR